MNAIHSAEVSDPIRLVQLCQPPQDTNAAERRVLFESYKSQMREKWCRPSSGLHYFLEPRSRLYKAATFKSITHDQSAWLKVVLSLAYRAGLLRLRVNTLYQQIVVRAFLSKCLFNRDVCWQMLSGSRGFLFVDHLLVDLNSSYQHALSHFEALQHLFDLLRTLNND